jgi:hypothetical protein
MFIGIIQVPGKTFMQVGVRREAPNPNAVHLHVGVRCAHPNLPGY